MRIFLAAKVPKVIRSNVRNFIEKLKDKRDNVKWVNAGNIHITIHFFGEVNEEDFLILTKKLQMITNISAPFKISIKGVSAFPNPERPRVIWCGVEDKAKILKKTSTYVRNLIKSSKLDIEIDDKEYSPHLTIGRVKGNYSRDLVKKIVSSNDLQFGSFTINEFILYKSILTRSGPIYEEIDIYPLKGDI